jgi:hypothetical protein
MNLPEGILLLDRRRNMTFMNNSCKQFIYSKKSPGKAPDTVSDIDSSIKIDHSKKARVGTKSMSMDEPETIFVYNTFKKCNTFMDVIENIYANWDDIARVFPKFGRFTFKGFLEETQADSEFQPTQIEIKLSFENSDGRTSCLVMFADQTESLKIINLTKSLHHKDKMLASVSHELRTPLNGNINFIQAAIDHPDSSDEIRNNCLVPAIRSGKYLLSLINDILDMSQIQNKSLRLVPVSKSIVQTA